MDTWKPPPEFGPDGAPPPMRSQTFNNRVDIRWGTRSTANALGVLRLIEDKSYRLNPAWERHLVKSAERRRAIQATQDWLDEDDRETPEESQFKVRRDLAVGIKLDEANIYRPIEAFLRYPNRIRLDKERKRSRRAVEILRCTTSTFWERLESIGQLPPGASAKASAKETKSVSRTVTRELGGSVGITGAIGEAINSPASIAGKYSWSSTRGRQDESSREVTLPNSTEDSVRLYAVWYRIQNLRIDYLHFNERSVQLGICPLAWKERSFDSFINDGSPTFTSIYRPMS